jgi:hypothetical protein
VGGAAVGEPAAVKGRVNGRYGHAE